MKNTIPDSFPFDGEYLRSPSRRFNEVVVFVHHFGGRKESTRRHQQMILDAGFDCVCFNLYYNSSRGPQSGAKQFKKLLMHILKGRKTFVSLWIEELSQILDLLPGQKIVFSLSSPSTSVVGCLGAKGRTDIKAWVCDCGPFLEVWTCFLNYTRFQAQVTNPVAATLFNILGFTLFGGVGYKSRMKRWLNRIPKDFPVLSLRSGNDHLVPERAIEKFFNISSMLNVEKETFRSSDHLDAIKTNRETYRARIITFLQKHSSFLESSKD